MTRIDQLLASVLFLSLPAVADAGPIPGAEVLSLVQEAMEQDGRMPPSMAAPLRSFPHCDHKPLVEAKAGSWALAELTCKSPNPWVRIFRTGMPDRAKADARAPMLRDGGDGELRALTLTRPLPRGARIDAQDLVPMPATGLDPAQALVDPQHAQGRKLRRALGAGQPILERHLEPVQHIEPGEVVSVQLHSSVISIATTAIALRGGRVGDRIPIEPSRGGTPLDAVILAPGVVRVRANMPRLSAVRVFKRRL